MPEFLPQTFNEWLVAIVTLGGVVIGAARMVKWLYIDPVEKAAQAEHVAIRADLQAERERTRDGINDLEAGLQSNRASCERHGEAIAGLHRFMEQSSVDRRVLHEQMGKLEGMFEAYTRASQEREERSARAAAERDERLLREFHGLALDVREIKTKVGMFEEAKDDILALLNVTRSAQK